MGVSRKLKTPLEGVYFAFDEDEVGFDEGVWKDDYDPSEGMVSLDDEFYRLVIKAKIAANSWDGTNDTLDDVLSIVFNEKIGTYASANDNQDMTMTIGLSRQTPTPILLELLTKGYLDVKPGGFVSIITSRRPKTGRFSHSTWKTNISPVSTKASGVKCTRSRKNKEVRGGIRWQLMNSNRLRRLPTQTFRIRRL